MMERTDADEVPVLIVGGALSGLSSAVFLSGHGIPCMLVERHPDLLVHPRLHGITHRSAEIYRQFGLGEKIAADSEPRGVTVARAQTLADEWTMVPTGNEELVMIDQDKLEGILYAEAKGRGVDVRFGTELTSFIEDGNGVTAVLRDRALNVETVVRANYLIAADGADSPIRQRLGIECAGLGTVERRLTAMFVADVSAATRGRFTEFAYVNRPRAGTILFPTGNDGRRWSFQVGYPAERESLADYPEERLAELIREAVGLPDLDLAFTSHIPGLDVKVLDFAFGARVAERYRQGRVFLVGDAAHIMPPTGGLGGSTCIQDAHNLAWKLAAVLRDQASPRLLDTYEPERRPVATHTMEQALAHMAKRHPTALEGQRIAPMVPHLAVVMGYQYRSGAVPGAPDDGGRAPLLNPQDLTGQPGTRAPDVPVSRRGMQMSTLDLYGFRFVLLVGRDGWSWPDAASSVSAEFDVPIDAYRFGSDLEPAADDDSHQAHGIGPAGAVLIRPDGFVAWRCPAPPADPEEALFEAMTAALGWASIGGES